jgi:hypothetical protein
VKSYRKIATTVLAAAVPLGLVAGLSFGGTAFAARTHKSATGTATCTGTTATIKFSPGLVPGAGTKKEKTSVIGTALSGCSDSAGAITATKVTVKIKAAKTNNGCAAFASNTGSDTITISVKWSGGISPTTSTFSPGSVALQTSPPGFKASGGTVKGSFSPGPATFTVGLDSGSSSAIEACIAGSSTAPVNSLNITTGSSSF